MGVGPIGSLSNEIDINKRMPYMHFNDAVARANCKKYNDDKSRVGWTSLYVNVCVSTNGGNV